MCPVEHPRMHSIANHCHLFLILLSLQAAPLALLQDSEPITLLAVSPDCHSLVAASRSLSVRHWDWTSGECRGHGG